MQFLNHLFLCLLPTVIEVLLYPESPGHVRIWIKLLDARHGLLAWMLYVANLSNK